MDTPPTAERVAAVVALKALPVAKSRLSAIPPPLRQRLARCMALDTLAALRPAVHQILVISDQADLSAALARHGLDVRVVAEPRDSADPTAPNDPHDGVRKGDSSLNRALRHGDRLLRTEGATVVLACVGDLPALRTSSVTSAIIASRGRARCFVPDLDRSGTTMLIARGTPLDPRYGTEIVDGREIGSAERHTDSGAVPLPDGDQFLNARRDVDTLADLRAAWRLGPGPATRSLLDPVTGALGHYEQVTVRTWTGSVLTVQAGSGEVSLPPGTYDGDPTPWVAGRRLHAIRVADTLRCWA